MAHTGKLEHTRIESRNFGRQALGENYLALFQTELTGLIVESSFLSEQKTSIQYDCVFKLVKWYENG